MTKAETITRRVSALRQWLRANGLSAYIFPSTDPHSGEYVPDHWKSREWISGFDGSAGTALVTLHHAALWTDSRYWLAAEEQTAGTPFEVIRCKRNVPTAEEVVAWLAEHETEALTDDTTSPAMGFNGWTLSEEYADALEQALCRCGWRAESSASFQAEMDDHYALNVEIRNNAPEDSLWEGRPSLPYSLIEIQPLRYAGRSAADKLDDIRRSLQTADALVVTQLDEIAWTLNLRGSDIHCTPVFVAYLIVLPSEALLYVDPSQLTPEVERYLETLHVRCRPYERIAEELFTGVVDETLQMQYDPSVTSHALAQAIRQDGGSRLFYTAPSPVPPLRAVKNEVEIAGFRNAMLKDGVAMVQFLRTLSPLSREGESLPPLDITEMGVDAKLTALRAGQEGFRGLSFDTIAGYGAHAAIVHYEATPETDIPLEPHGLLLLDSGAQYVDGTTDITRTIPLGPLTDEERTDYTLVLKGHIRLASAVFPEGTTGTQLDVLARYAMWQQHKNYGHGTGHGVGSFLSVHEGPHQFRMNYVAAPLQAGMTVTIEPGIYIAGSHGVRIENTMLIVEDRASASPSLTGATSAGQDGSAWLRLEPLTLCPIDLRPVVWEMMLPDEVEYLNRYHARVREALLPLLDDEADRQWLTEATKEPHP